MVKTMNKEILNFYLNIKVADDIPVCDDVLNGGFNDLEFSHNWCQRAFPNYEPSEIVPDSPVLDTETLAWIKLNAMDKVYALLHRYMYHYQTLRPSQIPHNNRRVTRLLKFLVMLECPHYVTFMAHRFFLTEFAILENHFSSNTIDETKKYWYDALYYRVGLAE